MLSLESQAQVLKGDESFFLLNLPKVNCFAEQQLAKRHKTVERLQVKLYIVENGSLNICLEPREHCLLQGKFLQAHDIIRVSAFTPYSYTTLCWFMQSHFVKRKLIQQDS